MWRKIPYRIKQTLQALTAPWRPVDDALAAQHLAPVLHQLFLTMSKNDRQHHLRVYKRLCAAGHISPALLTAALLHDIGKTRYRFGIPERILAVAVKTLLPAKFAQWSKGEAMGWRRALVVSARHPEWGAEIVGQVCDDVLVLTLIRLHQTPLADVPTGQTRDLLTVLQMADDAS